MTAPVAESAAPALRTRVIARRVVLASVLGALVVVALSLYGDVNALTQNLRSFPPLSFLGAIALASGNYLLRFVRWQYYLVRLGVRVPVGESAVVFLAGFVMSVTPGKVGEVVKSVLLFESRATPIARTAPIVVAERLTDLVALVALTAIGSLAFDRGVPIAVAGALIVGAILFAAGFRPFGELLLGLSEKVPGVRRFTPRLREAYESLHLLMRPAPLLLGSVIATLAWALECAALDVILGGLGAPWLDWRAVTFAYSAPTIAGAVAMMPGGLGVTEAGMTALLVALSHGRMTASVATAATILVRLATLWWAVAVGLVALGVFRAMLRRRTKTGQLE